MKRLDAKWWLAALGMAALLVCACSHVAHRRAQVHVATWDEIQTRIAVISRGPQYRRGGQRLAWVTSSEASARDLCLSVAQVADTNLRIAADFMRSLTPEQVATMTKERRLPFAALSSNQQRQLLLLPDVVGHAGPRNADTQGSFVAVSVWEGGHAQLEWHIPSGNERDAGYAVELGDLPKA